MFPLSPALPVTCSNKNATISYLEDNKFGWNSKYFDNVVIAKCFHHQILI